MEKELENELQNYKFTLRFAFSDNQGRFGPILYLYCKKPNFEEFTDDFYKSRIPLFRLLLNLCKQILWEDQAVPSGTLLIAQFKPSPESQLTKDPARTAHILC